MTDLALCPHLTGEIALYDINYRGRPGQRRARQGDLRQSRGEDDVRGQGLPHRRGGPRGTRTSSFLSILPGPMQMFANDLDIPAKYGILQTVGDTTGPGGISRALRTVPTYVDYAHQIMELVPRRVGDQLHQPDDPLRTAALYAAEPEIKAFGCCHEVFGTQRMLARAGRRVPGRADAPAAGDQDRRRRRQPLHLRPARHVAGPGPLPAPRRAHGQPTASGTTGPPGRCRPRHAGNWFASQELSPSTSSAASACWARPATATWRSSCPGT